MKLLNTFLLLLILLFLASACHIRHEKDFCDFSLDYSPDSLELFAPGEISTNLNERDMAISPQGDELFYSVFTFDNSVRVIMHITKGEKGWSKPKVAGFSGEYYDLEPTFSPAGDKLFFVSNRPVSSTDSTHDHNIWYTEKIPAGWKDPKPLPNSINTDNDEFYPSVSSNGNLYFTARYPDAVGGEDIYMSMYSNGSYSAPIRLDSAINSMSWEFNAYISPDERHLIFSSARRSDGFGGGDLYISSKDSDGRWMPARNLGKPINSEKLDYCPFVDWPRNNFYFTSNRSADPPNNINSIADLYNIAASPQNGMGNIYRININALGIFDSE